MVHSFYRSENPSGENLTVLRQRELLKKNGIAVKLFSVSTDELQIGRNYQAKTALNFSLGRGRDFNAEIAQFRPSIVHVHNLFPNISETALSRLGVPYVLTIHNYRYLCANGTFFRDSAPCFECTKVSSIPSIVHGCYRNSRIATVPLAIRNFRSANERPFFKHAAGVIFPSEYSQSIFAKGADVSNSSVIYQPGPVAESHLSRPQHRVEDKWMFIGRLTVEKGVVVLLQSWPVGRKLVIAGSGPMEDELRQIAAVRMLKVEFLGSVPHDQALSALSQSRGLIFTSQWPDVAPLVYAEALSLGKPVLSLGENTVSQWVKNHGTGYVIPSPDPTAWDDAIIRVEAHYERLSEKCSKISSLSFSEEGWTEQIKSLYSDLQK